MRRILLTVSALLTLAVTSACTSDVHRPSPSPSAARAHVFYLDCSAPNPGAGSRARPWNTTDAVRAHGRFLPDEQILIRRATTCFGRITPQSSGTNGHPIVLGAYGRGPAPVIAAAGSEDQTATVQLTNVHDWIVQDLTVTNFARRGPDNVMRAGIMAVNDGVGRLSRIVIRRNTVRQVTSDPGSYSADPHSFGGIVVLVRANARTGGHSYDNVVIDDNIVDHVGRTGIAVWTNAYPSTFITNVSVIRNRVHYAEGDSIVLLGVDGGEIDRNTSDHGGHLPRCPNCTFTQYNPANAGIWPVESRNIAMRWNEVYGEGADGGDGEGFDVDDTTSHIVVEGNYSHDNAGGGVLVCGASRTDIRYNVLQNDAGGEITFSCPTQRDGVRIFNNDIYLPADSLTQVVRKTRSTGTQPVVFANNIVVNLGAGGYDWPAPVLSSGNILFGMHPPSEPADPGGTREDPNLLEPGSGGTGIASLGGYAPHAGSPAAGPATPIASSARADLAGNAIDPQHPGRGAFAPAGARRWHPPAARIHVEQVDAGVELRWTGLSDGAYRVLRSSAHGRQVAAAEYLHGTVLLDRDLPAGTYRYRVLAVTTGGEEEIGTTTATVRSPTR